MKDSNHKTIQTYNDNVKKYINGSHQVVNQIEINWHNKALDGLKPDAAILELGSGFGKDANYITSLGYLVQTTDASQGFVDYLNKNGYETKLFNPITQDFDLNKKYDLITANAVLLHFNDEEVELVLNKIFVALKPNGRIALSLKEGEGQEWTEEKVEAPRYFNYWNASDISSLLEKVGFVDIDIVFDKSTQKDVPSWLHIVANRR